MTGHGRLNRFIDMAFDIALYGFHDGGDAAP